MKRLLLATRNPGKVQELTEILRDLPVEIRSLLDYPAVPDLIEDGTTLEDNALKKARVAFEQTQVPSLADDSGLEVFHLNMEPGVRSARYAGEKATYDENNRKLLDALGDTTPEQRHAQFRCVVAFVAQGIEKFAEGVCPGLIADSPHGDGGFGYDPVFIPEGFEETFAELRPEIKNRISHRGIAMQAMMESLSKYFTNK